MAPRAFLSLFLLPSLCVTCLAGCGGSAPAMPVVTAPAAEPIDGRWEFSSQPSGTTASTLPSSTVIFSGVLHNNNGVVDGVGVAHFLGGSSLQNLSACVQESPVKVHGTLDKARHLVLTSESVNDTTFTFSTDIPADLSANILGGAASVQGKCATIEGANVASHFSDAITGTFIGTEQALGITLPASGTPASNGTATLVATETDPDALTGQSTITGKLTLKLANCSVDLPVNNTRIGAASQQVLIFPATQPVVNVGALRRGVATDTVVYIADDCSVQPFIPSASATHWTGELTRQP